MADEPGPKKGPKKRKLTKKQEAFIHEYLLGESGSEAARRAGYSKNCAGQQADENLKKPQIQEAISEHYDRRKAEFEISEKVILDELAAIAFGHLGMVADWSEESLNVIPKGDLTDREMKFLESIDRTRTPDGMERLSIKTMSGQKVKALELLGKHVGMWKALDGQGIAQPNSQALLGRLSELFAKRRNGSGEN